MPRCLAGNVSIIVDCDKGASGPPARPWRKRASTITMRLGAAPASAEVSVKAIVAPMNSRLRPRRSISQPVRGRTIALATRNDVSTHVISSTPAESVPRM